MNCFDLVNVLMSTASVPFENLKKNQNLEKKKEVLKKAIC